MLQRCLYIWLLVACVLSAVPATVMASEAAENPADASLPSTEKEEAGALEGWHVFFTAANVYPRLDDTEAKIDRLINDDVGRLFPAWEKPRTFSDWRDEGMLWDFQIGMGRDVTEKGTVYVSVGGTAGEQKNPKWYPPVGVDVDFARSLWFVSAGYDYYFWGRPVLPGRVEGESFLMQRLRAAKPYGEIAGGYINLKTRADVTLKAPLFGDLFTYQDKARYDLFYVSPRVGIEMPLTEQNSVALAAGYLFFTSHCEEVNNLSIYAVFRHRF